MVQRVTFAGLALEGGNIVRCIDGSGSSGSERRSGICKSAAFICAMY